jgi:hypothetical protein
MGNVDRLGRVVNFTALNQVILILLNYILRTCKQFSLTHSAKQHFFCPTGFVGRGWMHLSNSIEKVSKEIRFILRQPKVHYCAHSNRKLYHILSQINLSYFFKPDIVKIYFFPPNNNSTRVVWFWSHPMSGFRNFFLMDLFLTSKYSHRSSYPFSRKYSVSGCKVSKIRNK